MSQAPATFRGWAATAPGAPLTPFEYDPGPLGAEDVEVAVEYCGICHSDQSLIDNEWGNSRFPFIPGHEVVGTVVRLGEQARQHILNGTFEGWSREWLARHHARGDQDR